MHYNFITTSSQDLIMKTNTPGTSKISRRGFLKIIAFTGATAACWKYGLLGQQTSMQMAQRSQPIMGTVLNLTLYGPDRDLCEEALNKTIVTMKELEGRLSRHLPDSELSTLNSSGFLKDPSQDLVEVLSLAQKISRTSSGAFDVTILPLLRLYEEGLVPDTIVPPGQHQAAQGVVNYKNLQLKGGTIRLTKQNMAISLDGIGKGYIVDQGVSTLRNLGFSNVYVEAGGDLMVSGNKESGTPWRIGIRNPRPQKSAKLVTIEVSDRAVATSGDYMQHFSTDFQHHHILDPRSGFSPSELASCTVTAPNVALADGLATATMVLGRDNALELIESMDGCEAYMVDKNLNEFNSTGFFS